MTELERQRSLGLTYRQLMDRAMKENRETNAQGEEEYNISKVQLRGFNLFICLAYIRSNGGCCYDSMTFAVGIAKGQFTSVQEWKELRHSLSLSIREACCTWPRKNEVLLILYLFIYLFIYIYTGGGVEVNAHVFFQTNIAKSVV